jgi:hypothetical protein
VGAVFIDGEDRAARREAVTARDREIMDRDRDHDERSEEAEAARPFH